MNDDTKLYDKIKERYVSGCNRSNDWYVSPGYPMRRVKGNPYRYECHEFTLSEPVVYEENER